MNTSIAPTIRNIDDLYNRLYHSHESLSQQLAGEISGKWNLIVGPRSLNPTMQNLIARLGEKSPVRVLDGGNRFQAYVISRAVRGRLEILNRITISRAFTCYQVRALLESTPSIPVPFVVLDLLSTFYDESVKFWERKRVLQACMRHLERLGRGSGGIVSVHPPKVPTPDAIELLGLLQESAGETYFVQTPAPVPEPMKLF
jgi:hypothetical protein